MKTITKAKYLIIGGALALASCSQENSPIDPTVGSDRRIIFHTSLPGLTTRAKEIAKELPYFHLTAFDETDASDANINKRWLHFNDVKVLKEAGADKALSNECIWPDPGKESDLLHFFSYYPELELKDSLVNSSSLIDGNTVPSIKYGIAGFRVATEIADQVDFVTAYATGTMDDNLFAGINLKFRHQLSRIEVKAKGEHKSCDIEIAGVRIANANMSGTFEFQKSDADGVWTDLTKGTAEYIFREGDAIVTVGSNPVSIMGRAMDADNDNCALLIPTTSSAWDYTGDAANNGKGMYLNVLLRIIDTTPASGKGTQQYPYYDNSQGLNAMNIPREYFAVEKTSGKIIKRIYKSESGGYFTDEDHNQPYTLSAGEEEREFGWAALPISGEWKPGYTYCYTLDYSGGIGVHGPDVKGEYSPKAGDPVISDKVGVSVNVNGWQGLNGSTTHDFEVPGS